MGGDAEKRREKRWRRKEELWHCVDLVATLTDLHSSLQTPLSLFLVPSFFPPVLLGIKTSIHVPEETHSRGEKRRRRKGRKEEGLSRWDSLRITRIRPAAENCVYVCFHSACAASASVLLSQIWWHLCQTKHLLGKLGGKVWKLGSIQNFHSWTNGAIQKLCVQPTATEVGKIGADYPGQNLTFFSTTLSYLQLCSYVPSLPGTITHLIYSQSFG